MIPTSLGGCKNLVHLAFIDSILQGSIPLELNVLTHLEILHMGVNNVIGRIIATLGNLSSLIEWNLKFNHHVGIVIDELGMLT